MLPLSHRASSRALAFALVASSLLVAGCSGREPTAPTFAARIEPVSNTNISATVGTTVASPLVVRVTDENGRAVLNVSVTFSADSGDTVSPESARTDADGRAQTMLTVTTRVGGPHRVLARAAGVSAPAQFLVTATPGPLARVVVGARTARVPTRLDTLRLTAIGQDSYGNPVAGTIAWTSRDPGVLTVDATGLVRVVQRGGPIWVVASAPAAAADSALVSAPPSPCGSTAPTTVSPGQVVTDVPAGGVCLSGSTADGEYALVAFFGSPVATDRLPIEVTALGAGTPPQEPVFGAAQVSRAISSRQLLRARGGSLPSDARRPDWSMETALMQRARAELAPRFAMARQQVGARTLAREMAPPPVRRDVQVGDAVSLNENLQVGCVNPVAGTARVAAVSQKAVILSDVASPAGGFSDAEFQSFATTFDTLVYPLDVQNFGEPTDIDGNGRVVVFFTPAVNALTPTGSLGFVAGLEANRDLLPSSSCPASNQREMFYVMVPDPDGTINGNAFDKDFVSNAVDGVFGHELQHVINTARRLYVNGASDLEEVWLNEGLSHVAEELLFYRASGVAPRQNIGRELPPTQAFADAYNRFQWLNIADYFDYLFDPATSSPYLDDDGSLTMSGAAWSFLRYAADRRGATDGDFWYRLVNSQTTGRASVEEVLGITDDQMTALFRDWAVSVYTDDFVPGVDARFSQPSWDFRNMFSNWFGNDGPFMRDLPLLDGALTRLTLQAGGTIPAPFTVPAYDDVRIQVTSGGVAPPPTLMLSLVRVR